ncbi:ribonuclease 3 [Toxorhynchites rutilus septentrionalis]|uniref:ribonuclease 3 n=1 Tax=Toxorhynchites rutilus septentrionalis TaxID=329112 RepID=UPI00247A712F|nr:ribonuclease 3 [Toxorhynchites rutilus septentrionalis]
MSYHRSNYKYTSTNYQSRSSRLNDAGPAKYSSTRDPPPPGTTYPVVPPSNQHSFPIQPPNFSVPPPTLPAVKPAYKTTHYQTAQPEGSSYQKHSDKSQQSNQHSSTSSYYRSSSSISSRFADRKDRPTSKYSEQTKRDTYRNRVSPSRREPPYHGGRSYSVPNRNHDRHRSSSREQDRTSRSSSYMEQQRNDASASDAGKERPARVSRFKLDSERAAILSNWRKNYCETPDDIRRKLAELIRNEEKTSWVRSSPADLFYRRLSDKVVESTQRLDALCGLFETELLERADRARAKQTPYQPPPRKQKVRICRHKTDRCSSSDSSEDEINFEDECSMEELTAKIQHPYRLHVDLWYNDPGEMNDGPLCRCSARSRRTGIRHGKYPGEVGFSKCLPNANNADKLYHYRITISPPTNFLTKTPTIIKHDQHEFLFEGFSLLSHQPIGELPTCKVIRFNIEYTILYIEEQMPENFTIRELDLFERFLFKELLELVDFTVYPSGANTEESCPCYHFLPRFVRDLPDNGKEVLAMSEVIRYLLDNSGPLVAPDILKEMNEMSQIEWQDYVDYVKGMVVTNPGMKPCSVRVDQLDRNVTDVPEVNLTDEDGLVHPVIVHFGIRPPQLSYAGNPEYQKAWREYVKFRHLIANMSKPSFDDKRKLEAKENRLLEMRTQGRMKRNITVAVSAKGFHRTGIMCDMVQHAMVIPVLIGHLRFHRSLDVLEKYIDYTFKNRYILQLALTHPSYKENFGTNPDHARNSLTNCGIRQPEYGDRKIHFMNTRKRGINTLISIMSRFGKENETDSNITHNERLEFLGDAVVEFITSIHLFHMFPDLEEGGLATYRAAIVQNQHLAVLAKKLHLEEFMLYAHGSDLCHELELRHALANCFEALMGALLLDGGIEMGDRVFAYALFQEDENLRNIWVNYPPHPLQEQEPLGDRHHVESFEMLKTLTKFEDSIGIKFNHIRLLARAFTDRSIGFTNLTLGSNQRLEFLGDTVLQLICSEYLYRHFPEHHEGHLSLLRSSLVNNRTQSVVCDDLGMTSYAVYSNPKADLKTKDRADLLEAFLGSLYVDKGLEHCETFCHVCLFPRLQDFIMNQDWNDPKSKLQQCCLTLRTMDGGEPDIPIYKVIECNGPTNTRVYTVAVYFRGKRLACSNGHSIQQAEMNAAKQALENSKDLFPQLDHQKRVIAQSLKRQKVRRSSTDERHNKRKGNSSDSSDSDENSSESLQRRRWKMPELPTLPKQYQLKDSESDDDDNDDGRQRKKKEQSRVGKETRSLKHSVTQETSTDNISNLVEQYDSLSDDMDLQLEEISESEEDFCDKLVKTDQHDASMASDVSKDEDPETEKASFITALQASCNFVNSVQMFKVEGTDDVSSDLESGEIE